MAKQFLSELFNKLGNICASVPLPPRTSLPVMQPSALAKRPKFSQGLPWQVPKIKFCHGQCCLHLVLGGDFHFFLYLEEPV